MSFITSYFTYRSTIQAKQAEREARIADLPEYNRPLTASELDLLSKPASEVIEQVHNGQLKPRQILTAYGKQALNAQRHCNPLTEIMIKDAEKWSDNVNTQLPLGGFPISLKDTCNVAGYDSCLGYAARSFKPIQQDAPLIRLLKDAGGIPFVKTNVPFTLMSFESCNDMWGYTDNPHVKGYSAGGSTGGEAALLAFGGSRLGVGTDVAGSVRAPSHFSGSVALRCSTGRVPKLGNTSTVPGSEGIPAVYSPMASTVADCAFFLKTIVDMKPWKYDFTCHPIPWRTDAENTLPKDRALKIGVIRDDGVVTPTPACTRALQLAIDALRKKGHEIVEFCPPSPLQALRIASQLLAEDANEIALKLRMTGENNDSGVEAGRKLQILPRWIKKVWAWYLYYFKGDVVTSTLIRDYNKKTIIERWGLVAEREAYKGAFNDAWDEAGIDFLLTVPHPTPAFPHKDTINPLFRGNYTFLYNLLDYTAGVFPVTRVDKTQDGLPSDFKISKLNKIAQHVYKGYDAAKQDGLPLGVQVIGKRLQEELVLEAMTLVEDSLRDNGVVYKR